MTALSLIKEKPIGFLDLFRASWFVFTSRFKTILLIVLSIYVPVYLIQASVIYWLIRANPALYENTPYEVSPFATLVAFALQFLVAMAVALIVMSAVDGVHLRYREAMRKSFLKFRTGLWTVILAMLIILGLSLLLIIPGIIWGVYYSFGVQTVILKGKSGKSALDYSKSLVKADWWRVFGYVFGVGLMVGLVIMALQILGGFVMDLAQIDFRTAPALFVTAVLNPLCQETIESFYLVAITVLFVNLSCTNKTLTGPGPVNS